MSSSPYQRVVGRWRAARVNSLESGVPNVTVFQWLVGCASIAISVASYEVTDYAVLATITQVLVGMSLLLVVAATREVLKTKSIGKFCLIAGVFIFYWLDALTLSLQPIPFSVPEGFPLDATQFDQDLIHQALFYVSVFQLFLLVGHTIRPGIERPLRFLTSRIDSLSFDRTLIGFFLIMCAVAPLLVYYDIGTIAGVLLASRSGTELESPEPGLVQHLALFGIYGAALFFVYALKAATWRRLWWLGLAVIAALPFVLSGTRHIWLYISLPSVLIVLRGFKGALDHRRVGALTTVALVVLVVAQAQFVYRSVGWSNLGEVPAEQLSQINTNGQLTALLFAEHLVPGQHAYFMELVEPYFLIHWIPRQLWPSKPIMESWAYYNDAYVQGASFNVTPSIIGQFHLNWGLAGVVFVGTWLGFLTIAVDRLVLLLDSERQRATFVVVGMFYAFIISSFRLYSPVYFSYFLFGVIAMFLLTRRRRSGTAMTFRSDKAAAYRVDAFSRP